MKKYYFFTAFCENKRFLQFITESKNPVEAYNSFKEFVKEQGLKEFNITKFERIK